MASSLSWHMGYSLTYPRVSSFHANHPENEIEDLSSALNIITIPKYSINSVKCLLLHQTPSQSHLEGPAHLLSPDAEKVDAIPAGCGMVCPSAGLTATPNNILNVSEFLFFTPPSRLIPRTNTSAASAQE